MRILHLVCTSHFAGVERHIAVLAAAQHDRGHDVTVVGGDVEQMRSAIDRPRVEVHPVRGMAHAVRLLAGPLGRTSDIIATHMTAADLAAAAHPALRRTPVVSTRHFAAERGSTPHARAAVTAASGGITADIAVSRYIADAAGDETVVVLPGIHDRPAGPPAADRSRTVLMVQRLEEEKDTDIGLRAFAASGLAAGGWRLRIAGDGGQRASLESLSRQLGIDDATDFLGHRADIDALMADAGIFLAPCPVEGLGLSVLEAMAAGLPVVASGSGGHLESVGPVSGSALFAPQDHEGAATLLADLAKDGRRRDTYGAALRAHQQTTFSLTSQAEATDAVYDYARCAVSGPPSGPSSRSVVLVSLEPWDRVWRRNQHLVAGLLRADPGLRVLFVEPAADPTHAARAGARPRAGRGLRRGPHLSGVGGDALWLLEPTKPLPRRLDARSDARWASAVRRSTGRLGMADPVLWVNDPHGAEITTATGWPTLYDITDDWLEATRDPRTHERLEQHEATLMRRAVEVVVCSPGLRRTKGRLRPVTLLRNAVDPVTARPAPRPTDLPGGATAVYVGTLHSDRLDVALCETTARTIAPEGTLVLVGPDALTGPEGERLRAAGVNILGAKDHREVPGYLQHADVLLVPHVVDDFTDSLDPIKLYEYLAVGRPVVTTAVSGFREAEGPRVTVVDAAGFGAAVRARLPATDHFPEGAQPDVPTWQDRVVEMQTVIDRLRPGQQAPEDGPGTVPLDVRLQLGHAAVQRLADLQGLDVLHIKGHSLDDSLGYPGRRSSDADVLVRPDHVDALLAACTRHGYQVVDRFTTSGPFEHSTTLWHRLWGYLDVHRLFPGIGLAPEQAFATLWERRTTRDIASVQCPAPDLASQAVLLVLHAARDTSSGRADEDVTHVWHAADPSARAKIRTRVEELRAHVAFTVGIGRVADLPPSRQLDLWTAVTDPSRLREWSARIAAAPTLREQARLVARLPLVNTDHLAMRLGHRPTAREVTRTFVARAARAATELRGRR